MNDFTSRLPRQLYRACQVQQLDRIAIDEFGIAGFKLMQTAAAAAFSALLEQWPQTRHLQVFAGSGNNGGDGYIMAGLAQENGMTAEVIQLGDATKLKGDAKEACDWAQQQRVSMIAFADFHPDSDADRAHTVIIDALLGTGLDRAVAGDYKTAIDSINSADWPVVAIDIPSGLSADTGQAMGSTVVADLTVTFIGMKQGLLTCQGRDYVGSIVFSSLDVPDEIFGHESTPAPSAERIDINYATRHLLPRRRSSHKGSHGHVVVVGGDYGFGGAAMMAAEAAQRTGAGLVSLITRSAHRPALLARRPEIMVLGTEDQGVAVDELIAKADVVVIGPGLGASDWSRGLLQMALAAQVANDKPLVIDADGLNLLAQRSGSGAVLKRDNWILTPHPGEAANLLGCSVSDIQSDRFAAVAELNSRWGGCCLLKGSGSLICCSDQQQLFLCTEGNAGMASAGMGDILSGVIGGLVAQGLALQHSLCSAVCIHGEAADLAMEAGGERGMVATDLFPYIRQLVNPSL
jgi:NAD(P)H-hydrate epimerase